jgi:hypothetical protein
MVMRNTSGFAGGVNGEDCAHRDVAGGVAIRRKRARKAVNGFIRGQRITTNVGWINIGFTTGASRKAIGRCQGSKVSRFRDPLSRHRDTQSFSR